MFIFLLQIRHMLGGHPEIYLFAVYSALIWIIWIVKVLMSRRYRPYTDDFHGTTSVVAVSYTHLRAHETQWRISDAGL